MNLIGIIVTYEPDLISLTALLNALCPQVNEIVIVDNCSIVDFQPLLFQFSSFSIHIVKLDENFGIAYAQNKGIEFARNLNATHVLLMDQDSIPSQEMVSILMNTMNKAELDSLNKKPVAAVGPSYIDKRSGEKSFFVVEKNSHPWRWKLEDGDSVPPHIEAAFLISSGMLIKISTLFDVGGKRSCYFIDHVDTEWSFRVIADGYRLLGVPMAEMQHNLGDEVKRVWFFGWRQVSYHAPLRDYYMFRNTILMLKDIPMSFVWKSHFIWRLIQFAGYFLTFTPLRKERFIKMSMGIMHGLKNNRGKLDIHTNSCHAIPKTAIDPVCRK